LRAGGTKSCGCGHFGTEAMKKKWADPEFKKRVSEKISQAWSKPGIKRKRFKSPIIDLTNKSEIKLMGYINEVSPDGWEFVGDGKVVIDGKVPDFINKDMLQVIELFGKFWHKPQEEKTRKDFFAQYGYETLIVWWKELFRPIKLRQKLKAFCRNGLIPALQKEGPR